MKALFIVDMQNDFCPNGSLPAPKGDTIVPVINKLMPKFDVVLASKDWHPKNTIHFKKWPEHCIQGTDGASFHPELNRSKINKVFLKGTANRDDGYSAFEATNEKLLDYLNKNKIDTIYITGLTIEYCVKQTVLDALKYGIKTFVIKDAVEGIYQHENELTEAFSDMEKAGATLITSYKITTIST